MWATSRSCQVMTCLPLIALLVVHPVSQDLSVAGLRKGLAGERSGLFMEQIRIVKEMRERTHGQKPRYMVWENVCFDADTLVTCDTGYKRIEDVAVGNLVKTMSGRYMPVMKVFRTGNQKVIRLKVSGAEDLIVTPNHPFWAREKTYPKGKNREIGEPKWVRADELTSGHMIAYKADTPSLPDGFISECEAFALGRWLADGSVDIKKSTPRIFISCGLLKADETEAELRKLPWNIHKNQVHKTAVNFCFTSAEFYGLIKDAGRGAGNKSVPSFVFNLPIFLQKEVLRGYTSGDGYIRQRGNNTEYSASTASRKLAYGIARLIRNVYRVAANISVRKPKDGLIGCRVLHANYPSYNITASLSNKVTTGYDDGEFIWQCVKSIEPEEEKRTVFNLSVYGDNTYGANDVVVHNCGAFSSNGGKDFQAVLTEIVRIAEPESPDVPLPEKNGRSPDACTMSWADGRLLGEYTMPSFGEYPKEENASRLSQILEASPHPRFVLSAKACQGILNRAKRRGKKLPEPLRMALLLQSQPHMEQSGMGMPGHIAEETLLSRAKTEQQSVSRNEPESRGEGKES